METQPLTAHDRLHRLTYPMGEPPRPTAEDTAAATAWVDNEYRPTVSPSYFETHRADLIRQTAVSIMIERQDREWKARFAPQMLEAAE